MELIVYSSEKDITEDGLYLMKTDWNDWWEYDVLYRLHLSYQENQIDLGFLKIGKKGFDENHKSGDQVIEPGTYQALPEHYFSVGVDLDYYIKIRNLGHQGREKLLKILRDISFDPDIYREFKNERVMKKALLRSVNVSDILGKFNRVALGHSNPTPHYFTYQLGEKEEVKKLYFETDPSSILPSNIHTIIGRNGVGKTHLLKDILVSLLKGNEKKLIPDQRTNFNGAIFVSFSAFDDNLIDETIIKDTGNNRLYNYVGLKKKNNNQIVNKSTDELVQEFIKSLRNIKKTKINMLRWEAALKTLETETLFGNIGILETVVAEDLDFEEIAEIFRKMSSGHKIVLLTITKLIEVATEKILILMDEPETHLHPPLLSAFIRALSDFLQSCNGVTIIATHSPVILQEVPNNCVWIIQRMNNLVDAYRPGIQTFGENIGILTREVFGLEVVNTGFHTIIENLVRKNYTYEDIIQNVGDLGKEAEYLLRYLLHNQRGDK